MKPVCNIHWFRRDLRLKDNASLYHALTGEFPTLCIFIFDKDILGKLKDESDRRITFIYDHLMKIKKQLLEKGSDLIIYYDTPKSAWEKVISQYDVKEVYANEDYEPYAQKRDRAIGRFLKDHNIELNLFKDQCIFRPGEVLKNDSKPYTVYTPFKNQWKKVFFAGESVPDFPSHKKSNYLPCEESKAVSLEEMGFRYSLLSNITQTIKTKTLREYHLKRDYPCEPQGTSLLGTHLRFGTVSIRKCVRVALELSETWLDELIWREFFMHILYHFPHVTKKSFKSKYDRIQWVNDRSLFNKWKVGKTGYPLVDAGMRELNETGFMHNRVRMVTASFLVKHLLVDWRWGEKYFAEKLLDFDLSANNGNWQWVAGCGCDAAPYFRIFNPHTQLKKFDQNYEYVKKWVPEWGTDDYVGEIIDHKFAYNRALATYKEAVA